MGLTLDIQKLDDSLIDIKHTAGQLKEKLGRKNSTEIKQTAD